MSPIQFIVIYGNPCDGFNYVGPFERRDDAVSYAEDEPYNGAWWIATLDAPAALETYEGHQREYNPDNYRGI